MLKSVLYYLLLLTTAARFIDMVYILSRSSTNLPVPVIVVTAAMILYGVVLLAKKFIGNILLKSLMWFYMVQILMIVFNLVYVSIVCPFQISTAETIIVGTFLDIIISGFAVYMCSKQMRSHYFTVAGSAATSNRHV